MSAEKAAEDRALPPAAEQPIVLRVVDPGGELEDRAMLTLLIAALAAADPGAQAVQASVSANPRSAELFERDWVLMNWALKFHDRDRDILLSPAEIQGATEAFREIADADGDGRVTPGEYGDARSFILARY